MEIVPTDLEALEKASADLATGRRTTAATPKSVASLDHDDIFKAFAANERKFTAKGRNEAREKADADAADKAAVAAVEGTTLSSRTRLDTYAPPHVAPTIASLNPQEVMAKFKARELEIAARRGPK